MAVVDGAREVSYRELDEWSTRLARVLIEAGVGPERAVGVAMDRCVELVVAWWAVIKAGGVYVPVDRAHPVERIATVLDAVGGGVCVDLRRRHRGRGRGAPGAAHRRSGRVRAVRGSDYRRRPAGGAAGGQHRLCDVHVGVHRCPQGGARSAHAGCWAAGGATARCIGLGADARVLMVAAPTFDASIFEWLLAVGSGAALVVAPPEAYAGEALTALLQQPAGQRGVVDADGAVVAGSGPAGRGGHADHRRGGLPGGVGGRLGAGSADVQRLRPHRDHHLGHHAVRRCRRGSRWTIGAPIPGVCALVLDARLNPAPIGVVGELYLGGPALARGYVGRAELTAERFVANPYGGAGARMYRTGDLVRWTPAGTLDYLGRADTQIKLRGQRIELGEIENTLLACPQVTQAAATVHHSNTGAHLVAYITLEHTSTADHDAGIVDEWQHVWNELYGAEVAVSGFGMDFRGWNSSYTDDPIPLEEMVEWRSATVDRIMALQPRRVLEIGAGSGLVLSQVAPQCEHYVGTDMSAAAIDNLARSLERLQIRGVIGSSC